jgi:ABC-type multidrug transport system fused ATPase/permease subunit
LPNGINTQLYNNGDKFSYGQKQRILIARSLAKTAKIYIFDESTSALDSEMENNIIHNIISFLHDKTIIFISHSVMKDNILELFNN